MVVREQPQLNEEQDLTYNPVGFGSKFEETSSAKPEESDHHSGLVARDPVAHAIVSPSKTDRHHDSLADIYLTGIT